VDERGLDAGLLELVEALGEVVLDHASELDLAEAEMAVRIAGDAAVTAQGPALDGRRQRLLADGRDQAFRQHHDAVMRVLAGALDDRAQDDVAQFVEADLPAAK